MKRKNPMRHLQWPGFPCAVLLLLFLGLAGCGEREALYTPGIYEGEAEGYHSRILLQVEVDAYGILDIRILESEETPIILEAVESELLPRMIERNRPEVDVVSGATHTSESIRQAVAQALASARRKE
ncbi:FMN-binding protein [Anaerotalea alkaliphila]|uniref:FMN-binding protein n=1 Tax=Anaerotalea alkaliphila TaxID=2662126 RepID=A0A7X5HUB3_9FIRM|nr:FMN-binding protein [Anaerotalea alkaliphila]NDL66566.1 FMN-binding protein [Anaerotalea alkaliphila]